MYSKNVKLYQFQSAFDESTCCLILISLKFNLSCFLEARARSLSHHLLKLTINYANWSNASSLSLIGQETNSAQFMIILVFLFFLITHRWSFLCLACYEFLLRLHIRTEIKYYSQSLAFGSLHLIDDCLNFQIFKYQALIACKNYFDLSQKEKMKPDFRNLCFNFICQNMVIENYFARSFWHQISFFYDRWHKCR